MLNARKIAQLLHQAGIAPASVLPFNLNAEAVAVLDFSAANTALAGVDLANTAAFSAYVENEISRAGARLGVGGYNENRVLYSSPVFTQAGEPRTLHLGIDLWTKAGTPVFAPLAGHVHSFANNAGYRDYGPTIILEHQLGGYVFYTLYGHLSQSSLQGLAKGLPVQTGQQIAFLGEPNENVQWPPHLHFQLITDLLNCEGDFFGVAPLSERDFFLSICPDPNVLLQIQVLGMPEW